MKIEEFEAAASACRNAQIFIEECTKVLKQYESRAIIRGKTYGMISAAVDSLSLSRANLEFCANRLYSALDEWEMGTK